MSTYRQEQNRSSIVPPDRALQDESALVVAQSPRRRVANWGGEIFLALMTAVAAIGLARFVSQVSRQDQKLADADEPGEGIIIRNEVLRVWLPQAFIDLVKREPLTGVVRTQGASQCQALFLFWFGLMRRNDTRRRIPVVGSGAVGAANVLPRGRWIHRAHALRGDPNPFALKRVGVADMILPTGNGWRCNACRIRS